MTFEKFLYHKCVDLRKLIKNKGLTQRGFARQLGYDSNGVVSGVLAGRVKVPADDIPKWADVLGLLGEDRAQFIEECKADSFPAWHLAELAELRAKLNDEKKIAGFLRANMAIAHATGRGVDLDLHRIAAETGLDYLDLAKAIHNNGGSAEALIVAADVLGVPPVWLVTGEQDPPWYIKLMRSIELPDDPGWMAEVRRIRGLDP